MKATDLSAANDIVQKLAVVCQQRAALDEGKVAQANVGLGGLWLHFTIQEIEPLARKVLERKEGELRRKAAQIGLTL